MTDLKDKKDIFRLLQAQQDKLKEYGIKKIALFGSYVKGKQNEASDIDLLIEFEIGKKNYDNFIQLAYYLEDLFGKKTELVTTESLSPYIKPYILREIEYVPFNV